VKPNRPVNLDLGTIRLPVAAKVSILHRISGVFLFIGVAVLLCLLDMSLSSEAGFAHASELMAAPLAKLVVWAVLAGLIYHTVAGVRHLLMDIGIGESKQGGIRTARITLIVAGLLIVGAGVWLW
jgi:succinate dehydrogenase / fumarate reductase, cytochrome b subunit